MGKLIPTVLCHIKKPTEPKQSIHNVKYINLILHSKHLDEWFSNAIILGKETSDKANVIKTVLLVLQEKELVANQFFTVITSFIDNDSRPIEYLVLKNSATLSA